MSFVFAYIKFETAIRHQNEGNEKISDIREIFLDHMNLVSAA
jgi:hypothetical protein